MNPRWLVSFGFWRRRKAGDANTRKIGDTHRVPLERAVRGTASKCYQWSLWRMTPERPKDNVFLCLLHRKWLHVGPRVAVLGEPGEKNAQVFTMQLYYHSSCSNWAAITLVHVKICSKFINMLMKATRLIWILELPFLSCVTHGIPSLHVYVFLFLFWEIGNVLFSALWVLVMDEWVLNACEKTQIS